MPAVSLQEAFQIALQHHQGGRLGEAEAIYRQILAVDPAHVDSLHLLGLIASQAGRADLGIDLIRRAIALAPDSAVLRSNLGNVLRDCGRRAEAIAEYQQALALQPDYAEGHNNLGTSLLDAGRMEEAVAAFRRAIELQPGYAAAHANLGNALRELGRAEEAVREFRTSLAHAPEVAMTHNGLGIALADLRQIEEALVEYRHALRLAPDNVQARNNLGAALRQSGRLGEALVELQFALRLQPQFAPAHFNYAGALRDAGFVEEAIATYRGGLQIQPANSEMRSTLLHLLHHSERATAAEIAAEHRVWNELHAASLAPAQPAPVVDHDPERRLRIGYVSPDFRAHSVAFFFEPLLASHDSAQVEIFCYADVRQPDEVTARLQARADHWREVTARSDAELAELIRRDQIDLLIDLAGHTAGNRLLAFARKPAPIQATYLGYCDTTGLRVIDYRLTDEHADPPGTTETLHSEKLVRLGGGAWCFRPWEDAPEVGESPAVQSGGVTFGSFNALPKITPGIVALWSRVLLTVPGSRMLLKSAGLQDRASVQRLSELFSAAGLDPRRVEMLGASATRGDHLRAYHRVDIALDTFPYHGTTTTCEALWMGVPVVTLAGSTHVARVGVSLLRSAGFPEWIAETPDQLVRIAAELGGNIRGLSAMRASLRDRLTRSVLRDGPRFTRHVEQAYRAMWREWCARQRSASVSRSVGGASVG